MIQEEIEVTSEARLILKRSSWCTSEYRLLSAGEQRRMDYVIFLLGGGWRLHQVWPNGKHKLIMLSCPIW